MPVKRRIFPTSSSEHAPEQLPASRKRRASQRQLERQVEVDPVVIPQTRARTRAQKTNGGNHDNVGIAVRAELSETDKAVYRYDNDGIVHDDAIATTTITTPIEQVNPTSSSKSENSSTIITSNSKTAAVAATTATSIAHEKPGTKAKATSSPASTKATTTTTTQQTQQTRPSKQINDNNDNNNTDKELHPQPQQKQQHFWLLKAEPNSRIEKGKDMKFSIDDLIALNGQPADWDGVRNYVARNHMRAMRKGDLAFFYHSNCKEPGIVGIIEIIEEATTDETAFNPHEPYYDPKSNPSNPKWVLVKVQFLRKLTRLISLSELKSHIGGTLKNMILLKQSRLSVSPVSQEEWEFILSLEKGKKEEDQNAQR